MSKDTPIPTETSLPPLSALRQDQAPARELWPDIAARLTERRIPALQALREDRAPTTDLWPGIEARIGRRRRLFSRGYAAMALAASLLVAIGVVRFSREPAVGLPTRSAPLRAPTDVIAEIDKSEAVDPALQVAVSRPLTPETRALLRANLKIVNNAEIQVRRALSADPDAAYLESLLDATRQQKQDLRVVLADEH